MDPNGPEWTRMDPNAGLEEGAEGAEGAVPTRLPLLSCDS